jgi:DNA-3-methyladenine glycosylase
MKDSQTSATVSTRRWGSDDFSVDPVTCAKNLLGCQLIWNGCGGEIVETEAYAEHGDQACHTFIRRQARTFVDTQPAGTIYTYLNYGVHWLFNVLTESSAGNGFVLIRALKPVYMVDAMRPRRAGRPLRELCSGPGKLTQALGIDSDSHQSSILISTRTLHLNSGIFDAAETATECDQIISDTRIGISKSVDLRWRFLTGEKKFWSRAIQGDRQPTV